MLFSNIEDVYYYKVLVTSVLYLWRIKHCLLNLYVMCVSLCGYTHING